MQKTINEETVKKVWILDRWYEKIAFVMGVIFTSYLLIILTASFTGGFIKGFIEGFRSVG